MKFIKSLLMGTGGVVLAGLVLALLAPRAVHAVVATAVQVVNTSANPAITEDASRQASQIVSIRCELNAGTFCGLVEVPILGPAGPHGGYVIPANQYFVLKSMDTMVISGTAPQITISSVSGTETLLEPLVPPTNGQVSFSSGIVFAPGAEVLPETRGDSVSIITLHGYLTSN